jgi:hypothetical protein
MQPGRSRTQVPGQAGSQRRRLGKPGHETGKGWQIGMVFVVERILLAAQRERMMVEDANGQGTVEPWPEVIDPGTRSRQRATKRSESCVPDVFDCGNPHRRPLFYVGRKEPELFATAISIAQRVVIS